MRSAVELIVRPEFAVHTVWCRDDHRGWSAPEQRSGYGLVLVRRGRFRRRAAGSVTDVDRTIGYVTLPGDEECFAHPAGGDVCTSITLAPELWESLPENRTLYVNARTDVAHRRLLAATTTGDAAYAAVEQLLALLTEVLPTPHAPSKTDRALAARARTAILENHPAAQGLLPLAELLEVSPYRLSRAFTRELGISLTRYRNRVRVGRALDRLEAGEQNLATLAADLGFADQPHLTRTIHTHCGHTPTALRQLLHP
ncbi:AraC-like DNA-binding protein [Amycolatopsis bartoniae]|uniref:AraC family transcriptional regulator n=1 Tax=Amycolatopsis bartoniae TaxID=941986 RepID=A0A8H9MFP5_9PSEU|nr:AraC family transcriptional regulator [Amycolatopsis bartoniae]MBB2938807.1 AraC-like DNA-binding protein [Amycolatopsis bartoniae]TVS99593.1 helix-turn-helix transcriptional regulator [Amycolatopsis bartoniae]GHF89085.1 AraC family transcriptional regulator [Amycolatopsis bartoniae]